MAESWGVDVVADADDTGAFTFSRPGMDDS